MGDHETGGGGGAKLGLCPRPGPKTATALMGCFFVFFMITEMMINYTKC